MNLVLPDHTEVSLADLERMKTTAIEEWRKADKALARADSRKRKAEEFLRGCTSRMRLLRILENK